MPVSGDRQRRLTVSGQWRRLGVVTVEGDCVCVCVCVTVVWKMPVTVDDACAW
jgi:hypothetical protein